MPSISIYMFCFHNLVFFLGSGGPASIGQSRCTFGADSNARNKLIRFGLRAEKRLVGEICFKMLVKNSGLPANFTLTSTSGARRTANTARQREGSRPRYRNTVELISWAEETQRAYFPEAYDPGIRICA